VAHLPPDKLYATKRNLNIVVQLATVCISNGVSWPGMRNGCALNQRRLGEVIHGQLPTAIGNVREVQAVLLQRLHAAATQIPQLGNGGVTGE
jgi:hypothetical protein